MSKYGLQLRKKPTPAPAPGRPSRPSIFGGADEDDDDGVEKEISRQAAKNKSDKKVEELYKKAIEEDPSVFDYDGVYDEMKQEIARPKQQDKTERKSKYIEKLIEKAKEREREHNIIYEKKLLKERSKEDHLYADKDKFVTSAYKKKLEEQRKWLEEERKREILEEMEDVTKKKDLSDFYFSLDKNIAFGSHGNDKNKAVSWEEDEEKTIPDKTKPVRQEEEKQSSSASRDHIARSASPVKSHSSTRSGRADDQPEPSPRRDQIQQAVNRPSVAKVNAVEENGSDAQASANQISPDHYKRSEDVLAARREQYLARKRAKIQ